MIFSALTPPGNIVKELELYKRRLFSLFGTVSSLVLPPLLPWPGASSPPEGQDSFPDCRTGAILTREDGLYLEILQTGRFVSPANVPPLSAGPLPQPLLVPHLFLMDWMGEGFKTPPDLPAPPGLSWRKGTFVTFELVLEPRGFWWEQVFLKEIL